MGYGDWNDGMNRVGYKGKGESIWLAWFQITCIHAISPTCPNRAAIANEPARWQGAGRSPTGRC